MVNLTRIFKRKPRQPQEGLFADMAAHQTAQETTAAPDKLSRLLSFLPRQGSKNAASQKKPNSAKLSAMDALPVEMLADETGKIAVAFGLRWRTLVKASGREAAQTMTSKAKGTHFVHRSHQLGYGILPKAVDNQVQVFPAAVLAAKLHGGTGIFALDLGESQYWIALVRNGSPSSTDDILSNCTDIQAVARIRALLSQFTGESITVFSGIRNSGIDGQRAFSLRDIFDAPRTDQDRLIKLPSKGGRIPKPLLYAVLGSAALLAVQKGYVSYSDYQRRLALEASRIVEDAPEVAWAPVVQKFINSTSKPSAHGIHAVRASLANLPVVWSGWFLTGARCQASDLGLDKARNWSCQGTYERARVADTSEQILARVKTRYPNYASSFSGINTMTVSWDIKQTAEPIQLDDLRDPGDITIRVSSQMQGFFPALSTRPDFKMVPHELPPPMRQDGKPHPMPPTVPPLFRGDVVLKGPLRTMDAMSQQLSAIEWLSVGLVFDMKSAPSQKGVSTSSMSVEMTGRVFGKGKQL